MDPIRRANMLPQQSQRRLRDGQRVRRIHAQLRKRRRMRFLSCALYLEHRRRDNLRPQHVERRRMHHHRCVDPIEPAPLQHQNLPARVAHFFCRRPDHADRQPHLIRHLRRGQRRAHRRRGNDVVPARMPNPRQESYSAQIPMCSGPDPAVARNAVGSSQIPCSTSNPTASSDSHSHLEARSSSNPSSGSA